MWLNSQNSLLLEVREEALLQRFNEENSAFIPSLDYLDELREQADSESSNSKNNFLSNKVDYFIAELDTETGDITSGCQYEFLGNNRYEKNMNYMGYMNMIYPGNQHGFTIIPGLGHTTNTYTSATFIEYIGSIF